MRDNDPPLQSVRPTQISLARYGLVYASKEGFGSGLSIPNYGINVMEDDPDRVHARHGVWCEEHHSKFSNKR